MEWTNTVSPATPNILLIVLESTRASHLSAYGYERPTTPHLDRLASEAVLYEQAISPAVWTLPAHTSLFTGLAVSQHGTHFGQPYLKNNLITLAELLNSRGYATAAFSTNDWVNEKLGFARGFDTFRWAKRTMEWLTPLFPAETKLEKIIRYLRDPVYPIGYRNNKLLQKWILQTRQAKKPFFAYTLYFEPHYPYRPHYPYARQFLKEQPYAWWRINLDPDRYMAGAVQMNETDLEILKALYDSRLAGTDAIIGRLLDFLKHHNILDETLLVIVADHGENLGEHGLMSHQYCVYDTLAHVPLIIRYPPLFQGGQRITDLVETTEIFTTIMDILGIQKQEIPNDVRGRSLIPEVVAAQPRSFAISEYLAPNLARMQRLYSNFDVDRYQRALRGIRQNGYKAIFASDGQTELFDLKHDPNETQNLADQMPEKVKAMQTQLEEWLTSVGGEPLRNDQAENQDSDIDPRLVKRLADLGYF